MISKIKDGIHVVSIDDAPHVRGNPTTEVFFTYCKSTFLEKVSHITVSVDGTDSTEKLIHELKINQGSFSLIILHGITVAGLNIVDISTLSEILEKPIIAVTENPPNKNSLTSAVKLFDNSDLKIKFIKNAGPLYSFLPKLGSTPIFYHAIGITENTSNEFFTKFCIRSRLPEQLLVTHKIASAWKKQ